VTSGGDRIAEAFARARADGRRAALMPYMMGGFPDPDTSLAIGRAYADNGADLIELGVPFSDPLADGPVIHAAGTTALEAGTTLERVLAICAELAQTGVPVIVMCYANLIYARGVERFAGALARAAASGLIVPDLPHEEAAEIRRACDDRGLALVPLVAPTTPPERFARIGADARGFVYAVSLTGTTGERAAIDGALGDLVKRTAAGTQVPVAVGFGIATPEQAAAAAAAGADGVIVGSRLVREAAEAADPAAATGALVRALGDALG
jgi:tryptophan synthase alpha chain